MAYDLSQSQRGKKIPTLESSPNVEPVDIFMERPYTTQIFYLNISNIISNQIDCIILFEYVKRYKSMAHQCR